MVLGRLAAWGGGLALMAGRPAVGERSMGDLELVVRHRLVHHVLTSLCWSRNSRWLVSVGGGGYGYVLWDTTSWTRVHELTGERPFYFAGGPVNFTADERHVVLSLQHMKSDKEFVGFGLWGVESGKIERLVPFPLAHFPYRQLGGGEVSFFPVAGTRLAVVLFEGRPDRPVLLYDTESWEVAKVLVQMPEGYSRCLDVSPDGRLLAIGGNRPVPFNGEPTGRISFFDIESGNLAGRIEGAHKDTVAHLKFSPDSRFIASGIAGGITRLLNVKTNQLEDMRDVEQVRVWDVATGAKLGGITGIPFGVEGLDFDSGGRRLAVALSGMPPTKYSDPAKYSEFVLWDWRDDSALARHPVTDGTSYCRCVAFSPDGRWLAMGIGDRRGYSRIEIAEIVAG